MAPIRILLLVALVLGEDWNKKNRLHRRADCFAIRRPLGFSTNVSTCDNQIRNNFRPPRFPSRADQNTDWILD
ncbi:hypothetical protein EAF04_010889 [Stromatinia cepivora]|nr:hypothetical protein EAF04_010889 [Stromatinia cepivora]